MAPTMGRRVRTIRRRLRRAGDVEGFVRQIVAGGLAVVAGLWLVTLAARWSLPWLLGGALVLLGIAGLGAGIESEIEY